MADFHLIPAPPALVVEGAAEGDGVGDFRGRVVAIGVEGTDPVIAAGAEGTPEHEGLLGWGTTYFLVADERKPAPVWVTKNEVMRHGIEEPFAHATDHGHGSETRGNHKHKAEARR
jgi:hypothetical protein